jgi:hypothetical protein
MLARCLSRTRRHPAPSAAELSYEHYAQRSSHDETEMSLSQ